MPKKKPKNEVLIYGRISDQSTAQFITDMNAIDDGGLQVSINTNGGDPQAGMGAVRSFFQYEGDKHVQIDGKAYSWGSFFPLYANHTVALDTSKFLFHRASYGTWFESSDYFTPELEADLKSVNADLEKAMRNKLDVAVFEAETGVTIKEIFSMDDRKDVYFNAKQAKKFGLVDEIITITPKKKPKAQAYAAQMAAYHSDIDLPPVAETSDDSEDQNANSSTPDVDTNKNKNQSTMTLEELQAKHPALYKQAFDAGVTKGTEAEKERVEAWAVFMKVDPEAVKTGIESGDALKPAAMAEFIKKEAMAAAGHNLEDENPGDVTTKKVDPTKKTEEQTTESSLDAELNALKGKKEGEDK